MDNHVNSAADSCINNPVVCALEENDLGSIKLNSAWKTYVFIPIYNWKKIKTP